MCYFFGISTSLIPKDKRYVYDIIPRGRVPAVAVNEMLDECGSWCSVCLHDAQRGAVNRTTATIAHLNIKLGISHHPVHSTGFCYRTETIDLFPFASAKQ